jgi:hypothetical protein
MRLLSMLLEVTGGFRPVGHLRPLCRADRFDRISDHVLGRPSSRSSPAVRGAAALSGRQVIVGRAGASGAPPRTGRTAPRGPGDKPVVRKVQISHVTDDVSEIVVLLSRYGLTAAVALRMERTPDHRWLCAHLEIV